MTLNDKLNVMTSTTLSLMRNAQCSVLCKTAMNTVH